MTIAQLLHQMKTHLSRCMTTHLSNKIINTPQTRISTDRSRLLSQYQCNLLPPPIDRTTKNPYTLRRQPQMDYRLFIPPSNSTNNHSLYRLIEN